MGSMADMQIGDNKATNIKVKGFKAVSKEILNNKVELKKVELKFSAIVGSYGPGTLTVMADEISYGGPEQCTVKVTKAPTAKFDNYFVNLGYKFIGKKENSSGKNRALQRFETKYLMILLNRH